MKIHTDADIENVYLYVSDALRYDHFPTSLEDDGTLVKTASSSALSCSAFSTLTTGLYPPQHGVWKFSDKLTSHSIFDLFPNDCPCYFGVSTLVDNKENARHFNNLENFRDALANLTSPFLVLDRELVTHAPYNYDMAGQHIPEEKKAYTSVKGYYDDRSAREIQQDYEQSAEESADRFRSRMRLLEDSGLLDDTLVIVTADHGEVLGEYGMYGHSPVLSPESVYVPTFFYDGGATVDVSGDFMAHVDIYPTLCSIRGEAVPSDRPGYNLFEGASENRLVFNAREDLYGAWDADGGYSFVDKGPIKRFLTGINRLVRSDMAGVNRRYPLQTIRSCLVKEWEFGDPKHTKKEAKDFCNTILETAVESKQQELDVTTKDQLYALGYSDEEI